MRATSPLLCVALGLWLIASTGAGAANDILFVGNSFTHGNYDPLQHYNAANVVDENSAGFGGVPGVFQKMTATLGYSCTVHIEAVSSVDLAYHYTSKYPVFKRSQWSWVILQDLSVGPTNAANLNPPGNVALFNTSVGNLKNLILSTDPNAKILLYETWARPDICPPIGTTFTSLNAMLGQLHTNYYSANSTYGLQGVAPVGDAFAQAITLGYADGTPSNGIDSGKCDLWYSDNYHESIYGGYLAAAVFVARITGIDPRTIPTGTGSAAAGLGISSTMAANLNYVAYLSTGIAPAITSADNVTVATGLPFTFTVTGTGTPNPTFSAGGLPAWASLDPVTGVLSGTPPDGSSGFYPFTITATNTVAPDATQTFTLNVALPTGPTMTSAAPTAPGIVGTPYSFTYQAFGPPIPTFSVTSGSLPPGLALSPAGLLSGTPTQKGVYTGTVSASNGYGSPAPQAFSLTILQAPTISNGPPLNLISINTPYSFTYQADGAPASTFSVASGNLPPGMTLSPTGVFSGTPTQLGTYTATVSANNGIGSAATQALAVTVQAGPTSQIVKALNCGSTAVFTGGDGVLYSADTYYSSSNTYTGTVAISGTTDDSLYKTYRSSPAFSYAIPVANGTYTVTLKFCENSPYEATGNRVQNISLQGTQVLSNFDIYAQVGTFTALDRTFNNVAVKNGTLTVSLSRAGTGDYASISGIVVRTQFAPTLLNGSPPALAMMGTPYSFSYLFGGFPTPTFSLSSGTLPNGVTLTSAGVLSGTPTQIGAYTATIQAANGIGSAVTQNVSITVGGNFTQWATVFFPGAGNSTSGPLAMPQHDGVPNLLKYFCDINPTGPMTAGDLAALPLAGAVVNGTDISLTLTYRQNASASGITPHVQTSIDLQNWQDVVLTPSNTQTLNTDAATGDSSIRVTVPCPSGSYKMFIRLNVTSP